MRHHSTVALEIPIVSISRMRQVVRADIHYDSPLSIQAEPGQLHVHTIDEIDWSIGQELVTSSVFFSFHPFADVCRAIFQFYAFRFAIRQKFHGGAVRKTYLLQVQDDVSGVLL